MNIELLSAYDTQRWHEILAEIGNYDFYHLPEYHLLSEKTDEWKSHLFVYREESLIAAWPMIIRDVDKVNGLETCGNGYYDATSVYGYPGPICNTHVFNNQNFIRRFHEEFINVAKNNNIVCIFSRLNPIIENVLLINNPDAAIFSGETIVIDLSETDELRISKYRKNYRYEIRKSRQNGMNCFLDHKWKYFNEFQKLYTATMKRVGASDEYFFSSDYFLGLREALASRLSLFIAEKEGRICSCALFVRTGDIVQYHLSATDLYCGEPSASKLIIDEVCKWAKNGGARYLHLGGGVGGRNDSLFAFKSGFSNLRRKFFVYKHIVLPEIYFSIVEARKNWLEQHGQKQVLDSYFPVYRSSKTIDL